MEQNQMLKAEVDARAIAVRVLEELLARRRLLPGEEDKPGNLMEEGAPHLPRLMGFITRGKPIELVLPAFPAKSPNRRKTLGPLPDHGEDLAFANLNHLCERIAKIYGPGAKITVCSDGRVFADLVRIPDPDVTAYNSELRLRYKERYRDTIGFFDLDDAYPGMTNYEMLREDLMINFGEPLQTLRARCKHEEGAKVMYRGIVRFLAEDYTGLPVFEGFSRNAIQSEARLAAYRVIQRSNAWSRLLQEAFPDAVRLSIHPQFRVSEKIGVYLVDTDDCWTTPWHAVALKTGDRTKLVPRHHAEAANAALIYSEGRPSHYAMLA